MSYNFAYNFDGKVEKTTKNLTYDLCEIYFENLIFSWTVPLDHLRFLGFTYFMGNVHQE